MTAAELALRNHVAALIADLSYGGRQIPSGQARAVAELLLHHGHVNVRDGLAVLTITHNLDG